MSSMFLLAFLDEGKCLVVLRRGTDAPPVAKEGR